MIATARLFVSLLALALTGPVEVAEVEVRLRMEIAVKVAGADGLPVGGAAVFLEREGETPLLFAAGEDGVARCGIEVPEGSRLRAAATSGDAWSLAGWQSLEAFRGVLLLPLGPAGTLALESRSASGPARLETEGWDLTRLLDLLGAGPQVYAGTPLLVSGLPAGEYVITLGESSRRATVRAAATALVVFE